jgi:hypothetical protein
MNNALRKPQKFDAAIAEATGLITQWEDALELKPSRPQVFVGENARIWLDVLENKMPATASAKVGRPAISTD